jgi:hypothetical protein
MVRCLYSSFVHALLIDMAQGRGAQPGFELGNLLAAGRHHC